MKARVEELEKALEAAKSPSLRSEKKKVLRNIATEMQNMEKGIWGAKLNSGRGMWSGKEKKAHRKFLWIERLSLYWGEGEEKKNRKHTVLDLDSVIRIEFGSIYSAELFKTNEPWRCVSLVTRERSYDFFIDLDDDVCAFVVILSRLCVSASGGISSRSQFMWKRALCKIEYACKKQKMSRLKLLIEAVKRSSS